MQRTMLITHLRVLMNMPGHVRSGGHQGSMRDM